jgi:hypothetical protein
MLAHCRTIRHPFHIGTLAQGAPLERIKIAGLIETYYPALNIFEVLNFMILRTQNATIWAPANIGQPVLWQNCAM